MPPNHLKMLNPEQKRAVLVEKGPLLIIAGAGAGKTRTIVERISHLIQSGVAPESILAITFTNKAAREMRERVEERVKTESRPFIRTFHSLGVEILREQAPKIGLTKYFNIFDRDDSRRAVKEALVSLNLDPKIYEPGAILGIISKNKGMGRSFKDLGTSKISSPFQKIVLRVWPEYEKILSRNEALDFDDLLLKTRNLLKKHGGLRTLYQNRWRHIHIDEYQDTNFIQYEISKFLVGKEENICVVGDVDQNIYSWRGASIKNILNFKKDYPKAVVIKLEENYRSTKNILEAANAVIARNTMRVEKNLFTQNTDGEKISLFQGTDEAEEAEFVATRAKDLIEKGALPGEIAVLYRANFQSRALEEALLNSDVPYQLVGLRFFERKEVKDILSYLRLALNPESLSDLKRIINVPTRGLGKVTVLKVLAGEETMLPEATRRKLEDFRDLLRGIGKFAETHSVSESVTFAIKQTDLEEKWRKEKDEGEARLENAFELANFASRYNHLPAGEGLLAFLSDASLQSDQDEIREEKSALRLMTVHAAKGLEFDTVFVTGLEDGLFPHQGFGKDDDDKKEEERRLFYVALTRAKKKLFLSYAGTRNVFGQRRVNLPSEFISDLPKSLIEWEVTEGEIPGRPLLEIEF